MERVNHEFDLSNFLSDTLSLNDNVSPHSKKQFRKFEEDPIEKMLRTNPREVLGFNSFGKPRQIPESTVGTPIQEFYRGLNVLVTGGTGFVGKILIEKLIRSIPHLGQIYILIRSKKGISAKDRFDKLLEDEVFLRMKTEVPDYRSKLELVDGDIGAPELGLSEADRETLQSCVHVVFHSAADVRFVNSLRAAVNSNLIGSKRVIDLAKGMKNLKSYVHVSTAYSNCVRRVIEEKVYKQSVSYTEILKLLEEKSDDEINTAESRILQGWPNTYTFSKALCEEMISEEAEGLTLCIFRPAVVSMSYKEPLRGWTDNIYGPLGLLMAVGLGVIHISKMDESLWIDMVPVDFTVNAMIAVSWENATESFNCLPVYNFTTSPRNIITWRKIQYIFHNRIAEYPFQQAVWYPSTIIAPCSYLERLGEFFLHHIPGHVLDKVAVATGKEPRLTKVYNQLSLLREQLDYFKFGTWEFKSDNLERLMKKRSREDKELFPYDITVMNLSEYFLLGKLGVKYFYLKESLEMTYAASKSQWLKVAHYSLLTVSGLVGLKLLVALAHVLPF